MSEKHGGPATHKTPGEIFGFMKNLLPAHIPGDYTPKPIFAGVASDECIRKGVVAFRDFMLLLFDRLAADWRLYAAPNKVAKGAIDYPFLESVKSLLINLGYRGELSEGADSLAVTDVTSLTPIVDVTGKYKTQRMSAPRLIGCLRFLAACGLVFKGVDLASKASGVIDAPLLAASYPNDPAMLTGLKVISIAHMDLGLKKRGNDDVFSRCDYRAIKVEDTDITETLTNFLHPLPEKVRQTALELHRRYADAGLKCEVRNGRQFSYLNKLNIIWSFDASADEGYLLFIRAKNTDQYPDVIERLPLHLQQMIARGFGCDRKLRGEPCQRGCRGFRIPMDDALPEICEDIKTWLDSEASCLRTDKKPVAV